MNSPQWLAGKSEEEIFRILQSYEQALATEKQFNATLNHMKEGFQMIGFDFRYLYVNDTVVMQSRFTREELIGFTMMEKYPGIENTKMFATLKRCMKERVALQFENEFEYPDGRKSWFDLSVQPVNEGLIILSMDITERKKQEVQREQQIRELRELIHNISHRLRQPVSNIVGISSLLDNKSISSAELSKVCNYMKDSAVRLDNYTREIVDFVKDMEKKAAG